MLKKIKSFKNIIKSITVKCLKSSRLKQWMEVKIIKEHSILNLKGIQAIINFEVLWIKAPVKN